VPSPEIPRLDGICVLLIDDDPQVRDALGLLLKRLGTRLLFAGSADEARSILGEQRPDVILCDIGMPHEDGFSFLRKLRASEQRKIPAVALTAYAAAADRRRSAEVGFDAHVAKPVELRSLAAMVRELAAR
jgi:CheY-like chemotaxis protein